MVIIEDSRQQANKHELKHKRWAELGVPLTRSKVVVGDYCLPPAVAVDTKASMSEIAQNIGGGRKEHERFIREIKLARDIGTQLYILVENEDGIEELDEVHTWLNPRTEFSPECIQGPRLEKAMRTIQERYGCTFLFCAPEDAADMIVDLLTARAI